jgi:hypothetical protein
MCPRDTVLNFRDMQPMTHRLTIELRRLQRDCHNLCCSCGHFFRTSDTAHSGYSKDGSPLYVGDCCVGKLAETAVRTYWQPQPYEIPENDASLWRYMDFSKFVLLLKEKALYFARADHVGDKFEGAKGASTNRAVWDDHYLRFFRECILNPPDGKTCTLSHEEVQQHAEKLLEELEAAGRLQLRTTFLSCWHESKTESEALWRLYCPPPSAGIAIRATYGALNESLGDNPDIAIGRVQYVDFRKNFAGVNDAIFRKRHSLSHEKEVRAVIRDHGHQEKTGIHRPIELNVLIDQVVISPFASDWFEFVVRDVMSKFEVSIDIVSSELILEPFY